MREYKFIDKWDENIEIDWCRESRIELNKIIERFNNWQKVDDFDESKSKLLLAEIEYGKQTIGSRDGGDDYLRELEEMEEFVTNNIN